MFGIALALLMLLDVLERFFKLRDQWSFARLEAVASHDTPEIIAIRAMVAHRTRPADLPKASAKKANLQWQMEICRWT